MYIRLTGISFFIFVLYDSQELAELIANAGSTSAGDLARQKLELKQRHGDELAAYDALTARAVDLAERDAQRRLAVDETNRRLALKEKQLAEIAAAMTQLCPREAVTERYRAEAEEAREEARRHRKDVMRTADTERDAAMAATRSEEEERKRRLAGELA